MIRKIPTPSVCGPIHKHLKAMKNEAFLNIDTKNMNIFQLYHMGERDCLYIYDVKIRIRLKTATKKSHNKTKQTKKLLTANFY